MHIQAMINAEIPGLRSLNYSTDGGGSYTTIQVSGWNPFQNYLGSFSAQLPNGWSCSYNQTLDRVQFVPGSGGLIVVFESQSMADLWGLSGALNVVIGSASTTTLNAKPMGICPIDHLHISDPVVPVFLKLWAFV